MSDRASPHAPGASPPADHEHDAHADPAGHDPAGHEHDAHADHDPAGHDPAGHDPAGHDHAGHDHAGHDHAPASFSGPEEKQAKRLRWVLATVSVFFVVEFAGARVAQSAVLEADALHLLMDVFALGMSLYAMRLAVRRPRGRFTFGLRRAEPLAALLNATLILFASAEIVHEGVEHLRGHEEPRGNIMLVVAILALVVNGISAWLLHGAMHHGDHGHSHGHAHDHAHEHGSHAKGHGHHLNLRGAWLHLMGDTLGSLAALAAALIVKLGGPAAADPIASFLVVVILVFGALRLVRDAAVVLLEAAPAHLPVGLVRATLLEVENVATIEALHVWTLGAGQDVVVARVTTRAPDPGAGARAAEHVRKTLEVDWVTVQADAPTP